MLNATVAMVVCCSAHGWDLGDRGFDFSDQIAVANEMADFISDCIRCHDKIAKSDGRGVCAEKLSAEMQAGMSRFEWPPFLELCCHFAHPALRRCTRCLFARIT